MSKSFPGPWKQSEADPMKIMAPAPVTSSEPWRSRPVATVHRYVGNTGEANARLIAAAPELLAALETAEKRFLVYAEWAEREIIASRGTDLMRHVRDGARQDADTARAAIAHAKGESK